MAIFAHPPIRSNLKALNKDKQALAVKLYDEKKHSVDQVSQMTGISKPTLYPPVSG
jgi:hypothetical protein